MKEIELSKGRKAIVDDDDFEKLPQNKWYCSSYGYAVRTSRETLKRKMYWMHREIMDCPEGFEVDHINGDRLDNRKSNLRICSRDSNCKNLKKPKTNTSGFKGVSFDKRRGKFRAYITINNKQKWLGYFELAKDAALEYNKAAKEFYKEFANLNELESEDDY